MKRMIAVLIAVLLLLLAFTVAYAGHTADQLAERGWTCMNAGPPTTNWMHCFPPGTAFDGSQKTIQVQVFSEDGSEYLGTELLIHVDLYLKSGQPCPQDDLDTYEDLREDPGLPYFACHHFLTGHH